ncbi:hypothetical protein, partial [Prevotella pectinovora]|uniref:hypothetical protein n=1 Tax=Prevotella pectinovora TaxID=1602169 RepID=UPI002FD9B8DC
TYQKTNFNLGGALTKSGNGARCLPMWRTMLAQVGHAACPSGAQTLPEQCPNDLWNDYLSKGVEQLASEQTLFG